MESEERNELDPKDWIGMSLLVLGWEGRRTPEIGKYKVGNAGGSLEVGKRWLVEVD